MSMIELSKDLVGTFIYGIPTGNNARREKGAVKFEVVSVGRKYFHLRKDGFNIQDAYCPVTGAKQREINAGYSGNADYVFFKTEQEVEDYNTYVNKRDMLIKFFYRYNFNDAKIVDDIFDIVKDHL